MMPTYILRNKDIAQRMVDYIKAVAGPAAASGKPIVVEVGEYQAKRSSEQNRKLHAILSEISENVRIDGRHYSAEVWKEQVRRRFIGTEELDLPDGSRIERGISTTSLNASQFSELIEKVTAWAAIELSVEV